MSNARTAISAHPQSGSPLALLLPFATILLWSANTIVTKSAADVIEPASIALYRWVLAFLVLTPFLIRGVWSERDVVAANWWKLAILGVLGMASYQGLAYQAAKTTTAINMGIIIALMPLMTVLLASVFSAERLTGPRILGTLISLAGLTILITRGHPLEILSNGLHVGDALMLLAVLSNALYGVLLRRWAIPLATWQQLYVQVFFGVAAIVPFWLLSVKSPVTPSNAPLILFATVFASLIAPMLWIAGVRRLGAGRATLFINLLPPIVALLAWLVLGEELHDYHVVGGLVALFGVGLGL